MREVHAKAKKNDYRILFELKFIRNIFEDYQPINLDIWRTFNYSSLEDILGNK